MGMGLRLAAFGRRSSANMGMGLRLAAFGRRSSAITFIVRLVTRGYSWLPVVYVSPRTNVAKDFPQG